MFLISKTRSMFYTPCHESVLAMLFYFIPSTCESWCLTWISSHACYKVMCYIYLCICYKYLHATSLLFIFVYWVQFLNLREFEDSHKWCAYCKENFCTEYKPQCQRGPQFLQTQHNQATSCKSLDLAAVMITKRIISRFLLISRLKPHIMAHSLQWSSQGMNWEWFQTQKGWLKPCFWQLERIEHFFANLV